MKKSLLLGSVVAATIIFTGCSGQLAQMANSGIGQQMAQNAVQNTAQTQATDKVTSVASKANCIPRMSGGSLGMWDTAQKLILTPLLEEVLKNISGEKINLPEKLLTTCDADESLKEINLLTNKYYDNLNTVHEKFVNSLKETEETKKLKSMLADQKAMESRADKNEGVEELNEEIFAALETSEIADKKLFSEGAGIFSKITTVYTPLLLGYDKEIAEFSKDNLPWAIKNASAVKTIFSQVGAFAQLPVQGSKLIETALSNSNMKLSQNDADAAARKVEIPSEEELAKEAAEL